MPQVQHHVCRQAHSRETQYNCRSFIPFTVYCCSENQPRSGQDTSTDSSNVPALVSTSSSLLSSSITPNTAQQYSRVCGFISPTSLPSVGFMYILALDVLVFVYLHCVSSILTCCVLINKNPLSFSTKDKFGFICM